MIPAGDRFPYQQASNSNDILMPLVPVSLNWRGRGVEAIALVDSGANCCVLPYQIGVDLGLIWDQQPEAPRIAGAFEAADTRLVKVMVKLGRFAPFKLVMLWVRSNRIRVILGQTNFFEEFDVCFHRAEAMFEIRPKN